MSRWRARACWALRAVAVALVATLAARPAAAAPRDTAPDPRRGERLDGRPPPPTPRRWALVVPHLVLGVPRAATRIVIAPVTVVTRAAERGRWWPRVYWALTAHDERSGLRPSLTWHSATRPIVGLRYFDHRSLGRGSRIEARVATGGVGIAMAEVLVAPRGPFALRARLERRDDAQYGPARFQYDQAVSELSARLAATGPFALDLRGQLDLRRFGDGREDPISELMCAECLPGFEDGTQRVRAGGRLLFDTRPRERFSAGTLAAVDAAWARGIFGDESHDVTVGARLEQTIPLGVDRALVPRVAAALIEPIGDTTVPFAELLSPTGDPGVRALRFGRIRGDSVATATLEYQWLVSPWADAALFVDAGAAWGRGFSSRIDTAWGGGIGLRIHAGGAPYWRRPPIARVDVAISDDGDMRFLLSAGE